MSSALGALSGIVPHGHLAGTGQRSDRRDGRRQSLDSLPLRNGTAPATFASARPARA